VIEVSWRLLREREPDAARLLRLLTLDLGPDISTAAAPRWPGVRPATKHAGNDPCRSAGRLVGVDPGKV
jgi:hypothetical protein